MGSSDSIQPRSRSEVTLAERFRAGVQCRAGLRGGSELAMRYRLRTLLILLAVLPPLLGFGWVNYQAWRADQERQKVLREVDVNLILIRKARKKTPPFGEDIDIRHGTNP